MHLSTHMERTCGNWIYLRVLILLACIHFTCVYSFYLRLFILLAFIHYIIDFNCEVFLLLTFFQHCTPSVCQLRRDIIDVFSHKYLITCNPTVFQKPSKSRRWPFANFCRNSDKTGGNCGANPFHLMWNQFHRWNHKWGNIRVGYVIFFENVVICWNLRFYFRPYFVDAR